MTSFKDETKGDLVASATRAAAAGGGAEDFLLSGNASFFEGFGDEAVDHIGDALKCFLRVIELFDERIGFGLIAEQGESVDFRVGDFLATVLFVMEFLLSLGHAAVQADGGLVSEEGFGLRAGIADFLIRGNRGTKVVQSFFQFGCGQGRHPTL